MKLNKDISKIGLNRVRVISNGDGTGNVTKKLKLTFLTELTNLGYLVSNPDAFTDAVLTNFDDIIETLIEMKGGDVNYVPLFSGFPENVPDNDEMFSMRILGLVGNKLGLFSEGRVVNGLIIPEWLFDLDDFGADPLLGRQTSELFEKGVEKQKSRISDTHTEWVTLEFATETEVNNNVQKFMMNNLYSKSSIKETLKDDMETLINNYGVNMVDPNKVVFKETKSYIMTKLWNNDDYVTLKKFVSTSTDILRMFASLTTTDISLSTKIKFPKMNRIQRRFILECLNGLTDLTEDLNRYKGLWLQLGRYIHPGEYRKKYSNTFTSFDILRNGKFLTFNSKVESAIEKGELNVLLDLLTQRPGIFGRKLHEILVNFSDNSGIILSRFSEVSAQIELKNLLVMESYFKTINDSEFRTVINKKGKIIVLPNNKLNKLEQSVITTLLAIIQLSIKSKLSNNDLVDVKVWIDSELSNYTVPLQQRKMSDGLLSLGRGSKIKFDDSKVLRMFTYWKESSFRTDLDLSLIQFDENMNFKGQVSYTNLSEQGIIHSGDITSSPHGAAEFIDIDLTKVKDDVRYVGIQIYKYSGEFFADLEKSYAGWMFRDEVNSDIKSFDIKTVKNKFNVTGIGNYSIPLIVDLKSKEIIFIDMYMKGSDNYNSNETSITDVSTITKELVKMIDNRPNMYDLISYNMFGSNATMVENRSEAEITYGLEGCDFNVTDVDVILSELL
tara:strand:+ start:68144 stop:70321 length:2178 start_codon:yes stop_codon:yes gene_type:complete